jgi:hypothetical protein
MAPIRVVPDLGNPKMTIIWMILVSVEEFIIRAAKNMRICGKKLYYTTGYNYDYLWLTLIVKCL